MTAREDVQRVFESGHADDFAARESWQGRARIGSPEPLCASQSDEQPESAPEDGGEAAGVVEAAARVLMGGADPCEGALSDAQALADAGILRGHTRDSACPKCGRVSDEERDRRLSTARAKLSAMTRERDDLRAKVARVEALTHERGGALSCGGLAVDAPGCYAGHLAARVREALRGSDD